jgi:hypothetical protein
MLISGQTVGADGRQHDADSPLAQQVVIVRRGMMPPAILCPHCSRQGPSIQYKVHTFPSPHNFNLEDQPALCEIQCLQNSLADKNTSKKEITM